ncbi:MAG: hypothetical protein A2826_01840 [Candidatus Doudnabacteria bacterium RIFCSPHIGHO2_01_FULL_43_23]|uniref:Uncharacterized protein n=1 Tax=Candidatus Doudnabacteria bacterium RIFCSPHIGHO2_01_FULL_43_23 TaxID=1817822 RepID=A0A1F5NVT4_9BACT|nr:MAG: hypothetical protein A2826_01840 [Candidatus Doudnabacteria bacterium RIFCSPHIGHO2_01_FULL_43_23]
MIESEKGSQEQADVEPPKVDSEVAKKHFQELKAMDPEELGATLEREMETAVPPKEIDPEEPNFRERMYDTTLGTIRMLLNQGKIDEDTSIPELLEILEKALDKKKF